MLEDMRPMPPDPSLCPATGPKSLRNCGLQRDFLTTRIQLMHSPYGREHRREIGGFSLSLSHTHTLGPVVNGELLLWMVSPPVVNAELLEAVVDDVARLLRGEGVPEVPLDVVQQLVEQLVEGSYLRLIDFCVTQL